MRKNNLMQPKLIKNINSIVTIDGKKIDLGKLIKVTNSNCKATNKSINSFTCISTNKTFTDLDKAVEYIVKNLIETKKVILK